MGGAAACLLTKDAARTDDVVDLVIHVDQRTPYDHGRPIDHPIFNIVPHSISSQLCSMATLCQDIN